MVFSSKRRQEGTPATWVELIRELRQEVAELV